MHEIKPCPFCGNKPILIESHKYFYRVICWECGCNGPKEITYYRAISAWNKRQGEQSCER